MLSRTLRSLGLAAATLVSQGGRSLADDRADAAAVRRLMKDPSPSARAAAVRRLAGVDGPSSFSVLAEALGDPHPYVRRAAAGVLGGVLAPNVRRRVADEIRRLGPVPRLEACRAFALWGDEEGRTSLRKALGDGVATVRAEAARWLAQDATPETTALLVRALSDTDVLVRAEAVDALALRADGPDPLGRLGDPDPRVRIAALDAATSREGESAVLGVLRGLEDASWSVRALAAERALGTKDRRVLAPLVLRLRDERARIQDLAHAALVALTGIPFDPDPVRWTTWLENEGRSFDPALREPPPRPAIREPSESRTVASVRFLDLPIRSGHVGFVIDASHSMGEAMKGRNGATRWDVVCRELLSALGELEGAVANVTCFADGVDQAFPRAARVVAARRAEVARFLSGRRPKGWTAFYDGIASALGDPELDTIVVLSDGAPTAGTFFTKTDVLEEIRRLNRRRRARIDVISVGNEAVAAKWHDLLERIAGDSGGVCVRR